MAIELAISATGGTELTSMGLFLTVVAWIVRQLWTVFFHPMFASPVHFGVDAKAIHASNSVVQQRWPVDIEVDPRFDVEYSWDHLWGEVEKCIIAHRQSSRIGYYVRVSQSFGTGLYHWLIVTIFALFYGVLKWVYRKRGKELAVDE